MILMHHNDIDSNTSDLNTNSNSSNSKYYY